MKTIGNKNRLVWEWIFFTLFILPDFNYQAFRRIRQIETSSWKPETRFISLNKAVFDGKFNGGYLTGRINEFVQDLLGLIGRLKEQGKDMDITDLKMRILVKAARLTNTLLEKPKSNNPIIATKEINAAISTYLEKEKEQAQNLGLEVTPDMENSLKLEIAQQVWETISFYAEYFIFTGLINELKVSGKVSESDSLLNLSKELKITWRKGSVFSSEADEVLKRAILNSNLAGTTLTKFYSYENIDLLHVYLEPVAAKTTPEGWQAFRATVFARIPNGDLISTKIIIKLKIAEKNKLKEASDNLEQALNKLSELPHSENYIFRPGYLVYLEPFDGKAALVFSQEDDAILGTKPYSKYKEELKGEELNKLKELIRAQYLSLWEKTSQPKGKGICFVPDHSEIEIYKYRGKFYVRFFNPETATLQTRQHLEYMLNNQGLRDPGK